MLVLVLESAQVDFSLQVRKADLALISMKEQDILMRIMDTALKVIINKGYLVRKRVISNGVMTSINT